MNYPNAILEHVQSVLDTKWRFFLVFSLDQNLKLLMNSSLHELHGFQTFGLFKAIICINRVLVIVERTLYLYATLENAILQK